MSTKTRATLECRLVVVVVVVVVDASHQKECLRQQSPMNCARKPSMAKNSSPSRAPKNDAQLQTTWRSAKHASEPPKTPSHRHMTASKNNVQIFKCETARGHPSRPSRRKKNSNSFKSLRKLTHAVTARHKLVEIIPNFQV